MFTHGFYFSHNVPVNVYNDKATDRQAMQFIKQHDTMFKT